MYPKSVMFRLGSWSPSSDSGESDDGDNATDDSFVRRPVTPDEVSQSGTQDSSDLDIDAEETRRRRPFWYRPSTGPSVHDHDQDERSVGNERIPQPSTSPCSSHPRSSFPDECRSKSKKLSADSADISTTSLTLSETLSENLSESESEWSTSAVSYADFSSRRPSGDEGDVDTEDEDSAKRLPRTAHSHRHQRKTRSSQSLKRPTPLQLSRRACSAPSYMSSPVETITISSELRYRHQSPIKSPQADARPTVDLEDPYLFDEAPSSRFAASPFIAWRRKLSKADFDSNDWERSAYKGFGPYDDDDVEKGTMPHFPTLTAQPATPKVRRGSCQCLSCSAEHARTPQKIRRMSGLSVGRCFWMLRAVVAIGAITGILAVVRAHALLASSSFDSISWSFSSGFAPDVLGGTVGAMKWTFPVVPNPVSVVSAELTKMALKGERDSLLERVSHSERIIPHKPQPHVQSSPGSAETYSVRLVASSGRTDLTKSAIESLASCRSIADVRVSTMKDGTLGGWGDVGSVLKRPGLTTDAVLLLSDDDVSFTCDELDRAFAVWSKNPDRMVGFFAYDLRSDTSHGQNWSIEEVPRGRGTYSLVSDRAAFVHRAYLTSLAAKAASDASVYAAVKRSDADGGYDEVLCRSFALSVAITSVTSKPPILVAAGPLELRSLPLPERETEAMRDARDENIADLAAKCLMDLTAAVDVQDLPGDERTYVGVEEGR